MGSQKTLGIAAAALDFLPDSVGSQGLIIVPVIVAHMTQILMDAPIAVKLSTMSDDTVKGRVLPRNSNGSFRAPPLDDEGHTAVKLCRLPPDSSDSETASGEASTPELVTVSLDSPVQPRDGCGNDGGSSMMVTPGSETVRNNPNCV